jgi:group I intron endonuclease
MKKQKINMTHLIYLLLHPITEKIMYIGKTKNIKKRYLDHCRYPKKVKTRLDLWKREIISSGLVPLIKIIHECNDINVDDMEKFYIKKYKDSGILNMTEGGDGLQNTSEETRRKIGEKSKGRVPSEETRKKLSKINYNGGKKILCYNINSDFIGEFNNARRANEKLHIGYKNISSVLNENSNFVKTYTFFFIDDIDIEKKLQYRIEKTVQHGEIFLRIDKFGNTKEYNSIIKAAEELNVNFRNIWFCLNNRRNVCGGFGWCYKEKYNGNFNNFFVKNYFSKKIYSTLLNIEFNSAVDASNYTGINKSSICNYLKGKQNPKNGDKWVYVF